MLHKIIDNNLFAVCKSKLALKLNKPAYIGMCVSELCQVLMYEFHYVYIKNKYDNKSKLLFRDTDSLMYEIKIKMSMKILKILCWIKCVWNIRWMGFEVKIIK